MNTFKGYQTYRHAERGNLLFNASSYDEAVHRAHAYEENSKILVTVYEQKYSPQTGPYEEPVYTTPLS